MAGYKGQEGLEGYKALFSHTFFHAMGTLVIVVLFAPSLWWLAFVDFFIHSVVDRAKGVLTIKMDWTPKDKMFWWALGFDQELHNITHLVYICIIFLYVNGLSLENLF